MNRKITKTSIENIKQTVSEMVRRKEDEQARKEQSFSDKIKLDTKEKTIIVKNYDSNSGLVSLV